MGTGIVPLPKHPNPRVQEYLAERWLQWTDHSDFDAATDFYGQQASMAESMVRDGESFARFRIALTASGDPVARGIVPLQVEVMDADYVPLETSWVRFSDVPEGHRVVSGIELDGDGRRVAYHMHSEHPNETATARSGLKTVRIPAEDVVHLRRTFRPKQRRGETWLSSALTTLWELEKYDDSERLRKILASRLTGFFKTTSADSPYPTDPDQTDGAIERASIEAGSFLKLPPNVDVHVAHVEDTGPMYEVYMRVQLRKIARAFHLAYHQLSGDNSQASFSSVRTDLIEVRRAIEQIQHAIIVYQLCRPVWKRWLLEGHRSRTLTMPGYAENPEAYEAVEWQVPGFQWVDPLKEAAAAVEQINNGLNSRRRVAAERGISVEDLDREIAEDQKRAAKLGLKLEGVANGRTDAMVTQAHTEMLKETVLQ